MGERTFYSLYFTMTGLHALHVIVGAVVILWARAKVQKGVVHAGRLVYLHPSGVVLRARFVHLHGV